MTQPGPVPGYAGAMDMPLFRRACSKTTDLISAVVTRHGLNIIIERDEAVPHTPGHCLWMLIMAESFYGAGRAEKANRWLGYVQGVMAAKDWATLEELKRANMPEGDDRL